jgi:hypothetical protein
MSEHYLEELAEEVWHDLKDRAYNEDKRDRMKLYALLKIASALDDLLKAFPPR